MIQTLSVSEFLSLTNEILLPLKDVAVEGEVSGFSMSQGKFVFFALKDDAAILECFAMAFRMNMPLEDGIRVRVYGCPTIYKKSGRFRMTVERIEPIGEGALKKAFEQLKRKLEAEGLFDYARKRSLPTMPHVIGLIGSKTSAAYTDFMKMIHQRWSGVEIWLYDVRVQGDGAVSDIVDAFTAFNMLPNNHRPDVLVLTRGGGSLEDLWSFNDEKVARAVFGSRIPVVCGVGHERDETLADYCADVRAATPTHAATLVVPDREEISCRMNESVDHLESVIEHMVTRHMHEVRARMHSLEQNIARMIHRTHNVCDRLFSACGRMEDARKERMRYVDHMEHMLHECMEGKRSVWRNNIQTIERILEQVHPIHVLERGYSITRDKNGKVIKDAAHVSRGDVIHIQFHKGEIEVIKK